MGLEKTSSVVVELLHTNFDNEPIAELDLYGEHRFVTWKVSAPLYVWMKHLQQPVHSCTLVESDADDITFFTPREVKSLSPGMQSLLEESLSESSEELFEKYQGLLSSGVQKEYARSCLPVNVVETYLVTMTIAQAIQFIERFREDELEELRDIVQGYSYALRDYA